MIVGIRESRDAGLFVVAGVVVVEEVVVLDALEGAPGIRIIGRRIKRVADAGHLNRTRSARGRLLNYVANGVAEARAVAGVEPHAVGWAEHGQLADVAPIFGDLNGGRFDESNGGGKVLAKKPAALLVNDGHLIIAKAVDVIFIEEEFCVVDEELADVSFGIAKNSSASLFVAD